MIIISQTKASISSEHSDRPSSTRDTLPLKTPVSVKSFHRNADPNTSSKFYRILSLPLPLPLLLLPSSISLSPTSPAFTAVGNCSNWLQIGFCNSVTSWEGVAGYDVHIEDSYLFEMFFSQKRELLPFSNNESWLFCISPGLRESSYWMCLVKEEPNLVGNLFTVLHLMLCSCDMTGFFLLWLCCAEAQEKCL